MKIDGQLILDSGSKVDHSNIGMTSKNLIWLDDTRCCKSCSCSCYNFNKSGICFHVVAYSYTISLDWYGIQYRQPEKLIPIQRKKLKLNVWKMLVDLV